MPEDTHDDLHADGEERELICPTCERPFGPSRRSGAPTAPLVEPIPDRPPLLWLKIAAVAAGAALLLGGSALAAYRVGVSNGQTEGVRAGRRALEASGAVSTEATLPASWDTSSTRSFESSVTTSPLGGSMIGTGTAGSMDSSLTARIQSLRDSLASGGGVSGLDASSPYYGGSAAGGGSSSPYLGYGSGAAGGSSGGGGSAAAGPSGRAGTPGGPTAGEIDLSARATVTASSQLGAARGFSYAPANLIDGRGDTCWAEGAPGYGAGQSVTFDFGREVVVTRLEVLPGYDKFFEVDRWTSNGRLKTATLRADSGTHPISLTDDRRYQSIAVPSLKTRRLTVVISSAYPAMPGLHSAADTSIGELRVYGR